MRLAEDNAHEAPARLGCAAPARGARRKVVDVCRSHLCLPHNPAPFVHRQMRLVAEIGCLAIHSNPRVRIMRTNPATPIGRTLDYSLDQRRIHVRAALDDRAKPTELPVCLRKQPRRRADFGDPLAEAPDRGVVRRLDLRGQATKASERQPVPNRFLSVTSDSCRC
jgi:hypothetical protein